MNSAPLKILLLGPVELKFEDKLLKINRRMERAILYVLALEQNPISRTKLIDLLWPDAGQSDPRAALRTALSRLRNELPDPDYLLTDLDKVWLDFDRCFIDIQAFKDQYQHLIHLLSAYQNNRTLPTSIVDRIQKALDLWRGNKIISGDNLEKYHAIDVWRQSINNKLNHRRKYLMKRLAEHYHISGQLEKALIVFMSLAKIDSSDVASQCAALDILVSMGRHQDAMNYCDTLENIYELEFSSPLPDEILSRCQRSQYKIINKQNEERTEWPIPLTMNLPLIGQQTELYQLRRAFSKGGWVSIQGALGIGKTRLVKELFETLSPKPNLILVFCREMEKSLPFSPIIHCLRTCVPSDVWQELDPIWINQLSLLLPELKSYLKGEEQQPLSKLPAGKQHLFDALLHVCRFISKKFGKLLLFVDNAHWADHQTLQVISYFLSQGFFEKNGCLVIASRPEERNPDLENLIEQSFQANPDQNMQLSGLSFIELQNLAAQVLDKPPSEEFINKLMKETSGNPFLALEIIRNILETTYHPDKFCESSTLPLPMSIQTLLRKRIFALEDEQRHLLLCVAALGDNLSLDLLETVVDLTPNEISKAVEPLLISGFLQSTTRNPDNENLLHFSNEIMREVVIKETSDIQLQILHRQIAQRMASNSHYDEKAAIIANHYLLGGDKKQAFDWLLQAADHAWILGAKAETHHAYQQAEKLLDNPPNRFFKEENILKLYQEWGEFAYQSNQSDLLEQTGIKLQYYGNKAKNPSLIGSAKILLANACLLRLEFDTALELIHSAIENFETINDQPGLITAIRRKGSLHWWKMEFVKMEKSARRVLELSNESELDENFRTLMEFSAKYLLNNLYLSLGKANLSLRCAEEIKKDYFFKLPPIDKLKSLYLSGYSNLLTGNYEASEQFSKEGLEIARLLDNMLTGENLLLCLSKAELYQGNLDQSYQYALKALGSAERGNRTINIVGANCIIGDIFFTIKNYTSSAQYYRVGQIREGFSNISSYGIENRIHLAQLLVWTDQVQEAKEILDKTLDICQKKNIINLYVYGLMVNGIYHFHERRNVLAEQHFIEAIQIAEDNGLVHEWAVNKISLAKLMMSKGKMDEARLLINQTLDVSDSKNMAWPNLFALELVLRLDKIQNQPKMLAEHQAAYQKLHRKIINSIHNETLVKSIDVKHRAWDQDHHFPY